MRVIDNKGGEFSDIGKVVWNGSSFDLRSDNKEVQRIVERVNNTNTWDTKEPAAYKNAPVEERSTRMKETRARGLLKSYLSQNGFGLLESGEKLQPDNPF